jgi:3-hydroxyacyl-[acyl-carrier protein] dehydratase/trans-2-decenoyl-[acyl-carrier protein] isomerase
LRAKITELYARAQWRKGGVIRHALDLDKIGFCQLVLGIAEGIVKVDGEPIYDAKELRVVLFQDGVAPG